MSRIVIALGGNALGNTPEEQERLVKIHSQKIAQLVKNGHQVVIGHGNGPQVGMIFNSFVEARKHNSKIPVMPLPESGAMSQGYIRYHMVSALTNAFADEKLLEQEVLYILTQTIVDKEDRAFENPTKPIGPFYGTKEEAERENPNSIIKEDAGRGFRKVVASPKPISFVGINQIKNAINNNATVIVGCGVGIPTIKENGHIKRVDGVIDKDFALAKIANLIDADYFVILTAVDNVMVNYNQPNQIALKNVDVKELQSYIEQDQFAPGSMLPKVQAAINFVQEGGKVAFIGHLKNLESIINEEKGTKITL